MDGHHRPLGGKRYLDAVAPGDRPAVCGAGRLDDQFPGQLAHGGVVAVGPVCLQHRELGIVRGVGALVAERPAQLEHLGDAADGQPLEVQLRRDAQVQREVVGVDVGVERARVGAAVHPLQDRRLDFEEAALDERGAHRVHRRRPYPQHLPRGRVDDEVEVPLPHQRLAGQPAMRVR